MHAPTIPDPATARSRDQGRLRGLRAKLKADDAAACARYRDEVEASLAACQARAEAVPRVQLDESLPITQHAERLIELIGQHQVVVVAGETGSGKTTQLPKICLAAGRGVRGLIGCTQPRRIAVQVG